MKRHEGGGGSISARSLDCAVSYSGWWVLASAMVHIPGSGGFLQRRIGASAIAHLRCAIVCCDCSTLDTSSACRIPFSRINLLW